MGDEAGAINSSQTIASLKGHVKGFEFYILRAAESH